MRFAISLSLALIAVFASVQALPHSGISSSLNDRLEKRLGTLRHGRPHGGCSDCGDRGDRGDRGEELRDDLDDGVGDHRVGHGLHDVIGDGPRDGLEGGPRDELEDGPRDNLEGDLGDGLGDRLDDGLLSSKPAAKDKPAAS